MSRQCSGFRLRLLVVALLWFLASERASRADEDPLAAPKVALAREHLTLGNKLYHIREFARAIEEYKAGALIEDAPVFQYNLAQAYRLSGRYEEALWHYDRFVKRTQPTGPIRAAIEQFTIDMKANIEAAASKNHGARKEEPTESANVPPAAKKQQSGPRRWYRDTTTVALLGSGTAMLTTMTFLLLTARGLEQDALADPKESKRRSLEDRANSRRIAGYVLGTAGVAVAAVGALRIAVRSSASASATSVSVAVVGRF
jgi:tetratricopeptide (TPR) repeat protein